MSRSLESSGRTSRHQLFIPERYDPGRRWPAILFLHGAGERGEDNLGQLRAGVGRLLRQHSRGFPAVGIFPQMARDSIWAGDAAAMAIAALDATMDELTIDPKRVYLTGISMGGYGTWQLASQHPERFAALVPVCGGVNPPHVLFSDLRVRSAPHETSDVHRWVAERIRDIPVWIFHGEADPIIPVAESRRMHVALQEAGADVRYTEFPGVGHNAWDPAYTDPELWLWLFAQRRMG